ncbi:MAG: HlyC/CorC family transporter [Armatimonadetes bacterium]|nr:HlyC/CorC family transporter [Armatimonadota bacterium]
MTDLYTVAGVAVIAVCLTGVFLLSLSEASLLSVSKSRMRAAHRRGDKVAGKVVSLTEDADFLSVFIVSVNVLVLVISNVMTQLLRHWHGDGAPAETYWHVGLLVLILVIGELWPKTYGAMRSEPAARVVAGPMVWLTRALSPIVVVMTAISNAVLRVFGVKTRSSRHFITSDEIRAAADIGEEEGVVDPEEGRMLDKVIDLGERTVRDIMVPRVDIVAAPEDMHVEDLVELAVETGYSRIPIYRESVDHITGVVYVNDLIVHLSRGDNHLQLSELARPPVLAPESKRLDEMLAELRQKKVHMAIIIDEFGGTEGLVTIEDILEELVGDIEDEHDPPEESVELVNEHEAVVTGKTRLEEINEALGIDLPTDDHDTIGGYLSGVVDRVPREGEVLTAEGVRFIIEDGDDQYVERVRIVAPAEREGER